jgi:hypothetical protein
VNKAVDYPPVANAGPNQVITLPQNSITLFGNQSTDDHGITSYEWSLSPSSKGKVVEMQVGGRTIPPLSGDREALIPSTAQAFSAPFYSQSQACAFRFLKSPNKFRNLLVSESFRPLIIRLPETFSIRRLGKKFVSYG